jgi:hypothetical protein
MKLFLYRVNRNKYNFLRCLFVAVLLTLTESHALAEGVKIVVSELSGNSLDYNNGKFKERKTSLSNVLIIRVAKNSTSIDTGITVLTNGEMRTIGNQLTFVFEAELAIWIVTCYPKIGLAFVNVHSDASNYCGAKMLSYSGACNAQET